MTETPYVVLHHASGLEVSRSSRDYLFSTGNLLDLQEQSIYSFQEEMVKRFTRRPLTVILWGMADRYGVGDAIGVEVITLKENASVSDVCSLLENRRLVQYTRWYEPGDRPGYMMTTGYWLRPEDRRPWDELEVAHEQGQK